MLQIRIKKNKNNIFKLKQNKKFQIRYFLKKQYFTSIKNNLKLSITTRSLLNFFLSIKKYNLRKKKICLITGKYKSINTFILFKRQIFKKFLTVNQLNTLFKK